MSLIGPWKQSLYVPSPLDCIRTGEPVSASRSEANRLKSRPIRSARLARVGLGKNWVLFLRETPRLCGDCLVICTDPSKTSEQSAIDSRFTILDARCSINYFSEP